MAKRKHKQYRTLDSSEVQGEGSYIKIKNLTIEEIINATSPDGKPVEKVSGKEAGYLGTKVLDEMIVDWNWVDDDDNPLPIPAQTPGVIASLPFQEVNWLLDASGVKELFDTKN